MREWLSEEEQYKECLSNEQISRIKDPALREIRMRHWKYRHQIFLDEHNITDEELERLSEIDYLEEKQELEVYRRKAQ